MNPVALHEVAHSGCANRRQANCPHSGRRGPASPPPVAAVPEDPTAPFLSGKVPVGEATSLRESTVWPAMAKRWVGQVDWKGGVYPAWVEEWVALLEPGESL